MAIYVFKILGENFLISMNGKEGKYGFFNFRIVEAANPEEGENLAVQAIRDDPKLDGIVKNGKEDPPTLEVEEVYELAKDDDFEIGEGFIWFEMNPKHWWQFWRK